MARNQLALSDSVAQSNHKKFAKKQAILKSNFENSCFLASFLASAASALSLASALVAAASCARESMQFVHRRALLATVGNVDCADVPALCFENEKTSDMKKHCFCFCFFLCKMTKNFS